MAIEPNVLGKLLVDLELVDKDQFDEVAKEAQEHATSIEKLLVDRGMVMDSDLGQVIAGELGLLYVDLSREKITSEVLTVIPEVVAKKQEAIAYRQTKDKLYVATSHPENFELAKQLENKTGKEVLLSYATSTGINSVLGMYSGDVIDKLNNLLAKLKDNPSDEKGVVALADVLLEYAHANGASDIHLEPLTDVASVRFRIDSVLHEVASYDVALHPQLVSRIKIMARLRTDEHAAAQDGRFAFERGEAKFDVRVSVLPVTEGENVVMRLLAESSRRISLGDLGMLEKDLAIVKRAATKPYGMILVVGPTGSGKTTTLYAVLQILNRPDVNIMTIEDPVEYDIEHVQQTQLNQAKKLNFATGLRAIVRQDPDIIMVGEIRDEETADIAVNSAMTGHLVLSTLHTNDAATTFPRLLEMGVESFLVASSIHLVVAQRLVRRICTYCRESFSLSEQQLKIMSVEPELTAMILEVGGGKDLKSLRFYHGRGCKVCGDTGYSGRIGIYEVLQVTDAVRFLITKNSTADDITKKAVEEGMVTMSKDGVTKMFKGDTTLEEILRVTRQ